jgi:hypothetical protein
MGDGEEWCAGRAIRWTRDVVCVALWHNRITPVQAVWVRASDVRRTDEGNKEAG